MVVPFAGYALAKLRFPGRKVVFLILLLSMMIPFQLVLIPQYIMLAKAGLVNTLFAITLPFLSQSMFIFMSRQFFYSIPSELEEAARIDGLSRFGTYFRIVLPISGTLLATIAILNFTGTWNSYLVPATYINSIDKYTLVVGLQTVNNAHFERENLTLAGVFLLSFPVMIFFVFTQRLFVQGIATAGIKS
jgi:multiple sugar transport system permease protein